VLLVAVAPRELAVPFVAASGFIGGLGGAIYNINQVSLRQAITPERLQGRMNATMRFIVWGTIPIGSILGGFLGGAIGLLPTIWIGAVGGLFAFLPVLLSPVRAIGEMPAPLEEAGDPKLPTEQAEDGIATPPVRRPYPDEAEA
jgi:MFS family permease